MCRLLAAVVFLFPFSHSQACLSNVLIDQEEKPFEEGVEENQGLRAFEAVDGKELERATQFIIYLIIGAVTIVICMFILIALNFEKKSQSKPYRPTVVRRGENYQPYQKGSGKKQVQDQSDDPCP